jgi:hypothetical protein
MIITIAVKIKTVSIIPAKISQAFKHFLLRLSLASFASEFLQSKKMNIKVSGCSYSLKLEGLFRSGGRRGWRSLSTFYPAHGSGNPCKLIIWWWFDIIDKERWNVWWSFLLICIFSIMLLTIHRIYLTERESKS